MCNFDARPLFLHFHPSKCLVFTSQFIFYFLFALRLDKTVLLSYWIVFLPLFIWKATVVAGAFVGVFWWFQRPAARRDFESFIKFRCMLVTTCLSLLLLTFEVLVCENLESGAKGSTKDVMPWWIVFIPLVILSFISIGVCIWLAKWGQSLEFPLFFAANSLVFIFVPLRIDKLITWSWAVVLIPFWIILAIVIIVISYFFVLTIVLLRRASRLPPAAAAAAGGGFDDFGVRRNSALFTTLYTISSLLILLFVATLCVKLDEYDRAPAGPTYFSVVIVPLEAALILFIAMSFLDNSANQWWFGIGQDFCSYLLERCPCLQIYGNVHWTFKSRDFVRSAGGSGDNILSPNNDTSSDRTMNNNLSNSEDLMLEAAAAASLQEHYFQQSHVVSNNSAGAASDGHNSPFLNVTFSTPGPSRRSDDTRSEFYVDDLVGTSTSMHGTSRQSAAFLHDVPGTSAASMDESFTPCHVFETVSTSVHNDSGNPQQGCEFETGLSGRQNIGDCGVDLSERNLSLSPRETTSSPLAQHQQLHSDPQHRRDLDNPSVSKATDSHSFILCGPIEQPD